MTPNVPVAAVGAVSALCDLLLDRDAIQCGRSETGLRLSHFCLQSKLILCMTLSPNVRCRPYVVVVALVKSGRKLFRTERRQERLRRW